MRFIAVPSYDDPRGQNERDLLNVDAIIRFLRRNLRLCLIWMVACLSAGVAFAILSPSYYTAYTTILLDDRSWRPLVDPAGGSLAVDPTFADSQVQVLQSDEVVGPVVDQNHLVEDEEFGSAKGRLGARIIGLFRSSADTSTVRHSTAVRVKRALSVRRLGMTNVVEVGFTSTNPVGAATIANAIAQSYIDRQLELKRSARSDAASHLRERLAELRDKAFSADEPVQDYAPATPEAGQQARARFRELQNSAETFRTLYNSFLQRAYAETDQWFTSPGARVITSAEPPIERSWPRTIFILAAAVGAAVAGGIGHALLRQATDHSLKTVGDVQRSTGLERVAGVPRINGRGWETTDSDRRDLQPAYLKTSAALYNAVGNVAVTLKSGQVHQKRLVIGIVAPAPSTGVSSVAAHLARILAETGQKTLLVDANWRKPGDAQAMSAGQPERKLAVVSTTIPLEPEALSVLVLRATTPISALNASLSLVTTLQYAKAEYDYIVVDFPSAEQSPDLEAGIPVLDKVLVVMDARQTTEDALTSFLRIVPRDKLGAIILNKIQPEHRRAKMRIVSLLHQFRRGDESGIRCSSQKDEEPSRYAG